MKFSTKYDINDYIGKQFYYLTVVGPSTNLAKDSSKQWQFRCICGNIIERPPARVIGNECHSKSCGCMRYKNIKHKEHRKENTSKLDFESFIGRKNNKLTVIGFEKLKGDKRTKLKCLCDCGNITFILPYQFENGSVKSCGCIRGKTRKKYYVDDKSLYGIWSSMISRCHNKNNINYKYYGERGIIVCDEWRNSFQAFCDWVKSVGGRPVGTSIDRINNDGPYCPENCRWVTVSQQARNKRNNIMLTYNGETKCYSDWAKQFGIKNETLRGRIKIGWSVERALTTKVKHT